jgi:hypothetical protein
MNAACTMVGNRGLQALIEQSAPEVTWAHYTSMVYPESLAKMELRPELSEMKDAVI